MEKPSLRPAPVGDRPLVEGEEAGEGVAGTAEGGIEIFTDNEGLTDDSPELGDEELEEKVGWSEMPDDGPEPIEEELAERRVETSSEVVTSSERGDD